MTLYKAQLGAPKNKRLLKVLQETGNKQLVQQMELDHIADRRLPARKQRYRRSSRRTCCSCSTRRGTRSTSPTAAWTSCRPTITRRSSCPTSRRRSHRDRARHATVAARRSWRCARQLEAEYALKSEKLNIIHQLLRAHALYEKDVNYVVQDGQVLIVDEFTGRTMPGRRWSEGLHQAVEAKEGVQVKGETQTLATITIQNYFRMYDKLAGMTGTAETEETRVLRDLQARGRRSSRPTSR